MSELYCTLVYCELHDEVVVKQQPIIEEEDSDDEKQEPVQKELSDKSKDAAERERNRSVLNEFEKWAL